MNLTKDALSFRDLLINMKSELIMRKATKTNTRIVIERSSCAAT